MTHTRTAVFAVRGWEVGAGLRQHECSEALAGAKRVERRGAAQACGEKASGERVACARCIDYFDRWRCQLMTGSVEEKPRGRGDT